MKRICAKCQRSHPTALHIDGFQLERKQNKVQPDTRRNSTTKVDNGCVNFRESQCAATNAAGNPSCKGKGRTESVETYSFYDNGSGGCFVTENLKKQLGIVGKETTLQLRTMHDENCVKSVIVNDLIVSEMQKNNPVDVNTAYTQNEIPVNKEQIPTPEAVGGSTYA